MRTSSPVTGALGAALLLLAQAGDALAGASIEAVSDLDPSVLPDPEGYEPAEPLGVPGNAPEVPGNATTLPAFRYGQLGASACMNELWRRKIPFVRVGSARGVAAPVRLRGPLGGVSFHSALPERARASSVYEIFDCRLVLALDDFARILRKFDVVEVVHYSAYRPPPTRGWSPGKIGHRHSGALALDAGKLVRRDGTVLDVEKDFHGRIGARTCGAKAGPVPATPEALALRGIVCEAADAHLFNVSLTPNYNWQHRNHFHLEVTSGARWFIVH